MKSNRAAREKEAFTFIVPMTMAIVVGMSVLIVGAYVIGEITTVLEDTFPTNANTDWRTTNQNRTVDLMGNISDGLSDIVDIEIVVIIITALSMAIFAILALGTQRRIF